MTAALDRAIDALTLHFAAEVASGAISHLGTTNCRRKNNTSDGPWSEHSWPNAVDVHVTTNALGDRVAKWMRAHPELWSEVFWEVPLHFDHVHGTANPRKNYDNHQVPPCAGGPEEGDDMTPEQEAFLTMLMEKEAKTETFSKDIVTRDELEARLKTVGGGVTLKQVRAEIAKSKNVPG